MGKAAIGFSLNFVKQLRINCNSSQIRHKGNLSASGTNQMANYGGKYGTAMNNHAWLQRDASERAKREQSEKKTKREQSEIAMRNENVTET